MNGTLSSFHKALLQDFASNSSVDPTGQQSLDDLVSEPPSTCGNFSSLGIIRDFIPNTTETVLLPPQKIPRIIHMTGKSRCVHVDIYNNHLTWKDQSKWPGYWFYFHDNAAVERLLQRHIPAFPHLQEFLRCIPTGAAMADIWRLVLLWEYGGIYTDMDQAPGPLLNASAISASDDAFLVVEGGDFLAQYFLAAAPRHPIIYFTLQAALHGLYRVDDVGNQMVPRTTGPEALRMGFRNFMGQSQISNVYKDPKAGYYEGAYGNNRTARVVGTGKTTEDWVRRYTIPDKKNKYREMGMEHFLDARKPSNDTCWQRLFKTRYGEVHPPKFIPELPPDVSM